MEIVVTCACGAGVILRPGKDGLMTGKCPLCSSEVTGAAILPVVETTASAPKEKGTKHA